MRARPAMVSVHKYQGIIAKTEKTAGPPRTGITPSPASAPRRANAKLAPDPIATEPKPSRSRRSRLLRRAWNHEQKMTANAHIFCFFYDL